MKVRALKAFEGIKDAERSTKEKPVYPKEGDIWEASKERADFLLSHGVVELVKEEKPIEIKKEIKPKTSKKTSTKKK